VDPARILHLARLAGLELSDTESRGLADDLSQLDGFVSRLPPLTAGDADATGEPAPVQGVAPCPMVAAPGAVPPDADGLLSVPPPREDGQPEDQA
jgi:Asp-tRNA(Asn)/Glu-tRNA(Gln) amidotransferase C subunit